MTKDEALKRMIGAGKGVRRVRRAYKRAFRPQDFEDDWKEAFEKAWVVPAWREVFNNHGLDVFRAAFKKAWEWEG